MIFHIIVALSNKAHLSGADFRGPRVEVVSVAGRPPEVARPEGSTMLLGEWLTDEEKATG